MEKIYPDLKDVRLTSAEYKTLKYIRRKHTVSLEKSKILTKKYKQDNACVRLWILGLITQNEDNSYSLIARGQLWLEYNKNDTNKERLHIALTTLSVIISFFAFIVSFVSLLK